MFLAWTDNVDYYVKVSFYGREYSTPTKASILYFPAISAESQVEKGENSSFLEVMQNATIIRYISNRCVTGLS